MANEKSEKHEFSVGAQNFLGKELVGCKTLNARYLEAQLERDRASITLQTVKEYFSGEGFSSNQAALYMYAMKHGIQMPNETPSEFAERQAILAQWKTKLSDTKSVLVKSGLGKSADELRMIEKILTTYIPFARTRLFELTLPQLVVIEESLRLNKPCVALVVPELSQNQLREWLHGMELGVVDPVSEPVENWTPDRIWLSVKYAATVGTVVAKVSGKLGELDDADISVIVKSLRRCDNTDIEYVDAQIDRKKQQMELETLEGYYCGFGFKKTQMSAISLAIRSGVTVRGLFNKGDSAKKMNTIVALAKKNRIFAVMCNAMPAKDLYAVGEIVDERPEFLDTPLYNLSTDQLKVVTESLDVEKPCTVLVDPEMSVDKMKSTLKLIRSGKRLPTMRKGKRAPHIDVSGRAHSQDIVTRFTIDGRMKKYAGMGFSDIQLAVLKNGLKDGVDISCIASPSIDARSMKLLIGDLKSGIDVTLYAKPDQAYSLRCLLREACLRGDADDPYLVGYYRDIQPLMSQEELKHRVNACCLSRALREYRVV